MNDQTAVPEEPTRPAKKFYWELDPMPLQDFIQQWDTLLKKKWGETTVVEVVHDGGQKALVRITSPDQPNNGDDNRGEDIMDMFDDTGWAADPEAFFDHEFFPFEHNGDGVIIYFWMYTGDALFYQVEQSGRANWMGLSKQFELKAQEIETIKTAYKNNQKLALDTAAAGVRHLMQDFRNRVEKKYPGELPHYTLEKLTTVWGNLLTLHTFMQESYNTPLYVPSFKTKHWPVDPFTSNSEFHLRGSND